MTQPSSIKSWRNSARLVTVLAAAFALTLGCLSAADAKPEKEAKPDKKVAAKTQKKAPLSGAELYAMHCNRCHPERYATERNAGQWKTIMIHMRVRANLPAEQARAILKFLQEDSGK
jgi:mono/diheme cytochrome c family protein